HVQDKISDLTTLFVDSNGTLGIITKVVLKIIPLRTIKPFVASFQDRASMLNTMLDVSRTSKPLSTKPFYLHFVTDAFYDMLKDIGMAPDTAGPWLVLCAYEGDDADIAEQEKEFLDAVERYGGTLESEEIAHHEWHERFYPLRIKRLGPSIAPSEVYVPLAKMDEFIQHCDKHFKGEKYAIEGAVGRTGDVAVLAWFLDDERRRISFLMGWYRSLDFIDIGLKNGGRAYSIGMWNVSHARTYYGEDRYAQMSKLKQKTDPGRKLNPHKVFSGPLRLSLRFNLLVQLAVAIAFPIVLWIAGLIVPTLLSSYLDWLMIRDLWSVFLAFAIGLVAGTAIVEIANMVPISFVLRIGGPFMRLFRKIFH
ncbi:MAG: FAD-linked oxidase C-terminal domain-containing protein, partial [Candidatus Thorarchaeota archaeon]